MAIVVIDANVLVGLLDERDRWHSILGKGQPSMTTRVGVKHIQSALDCMVQELCEEFGDRLMAVVVYGSHARETATPRSDVDLLVVVRGIPRKWEIIHRLEEEWARKGRRLGKRFQVMLASPEDVEDSVEWAAPLMLEIHNAHEIVFDRDNFFRNCISRMRAQMKERGIRMRKPGVWEVPAAEEVKKLVLEGLPDWIEEQLESRRMQ